MRITKVSCFLFFAYLCSAVSCSQSGTATTAVGRIATDRYLLPTNQLLTPAGRQVDLPGLRPQALAMSPDGGILVTSGKTKQLYVVDPKNGAILQHVDMPSSALEEGTDSAETDAEARLSLTGLVFSPDGSRLYLSDVDGDIKVFGVSADRSVSALGTISVPDAGTPGRKAEIPCGLAVSADGSLLYVVGNLSNRLYAFDTGNGHLVREWPVGAAPFDVVLTAGKIYVSNLGGRLPGDGDVSAPAGRGTTVRVDPVRYIANEGTVTVIDLKTGAIEANVMVGLHPSAMAVSPDGKYLAVANSGSDTVSVIDTATDRVVEKIWARLSPGDPFGAQPNALAFDSDGSRLFMCNGTQNAVAVIQFEPQEKDSKLLGLIPVGWFPGAVVYHPALKTLCVANIKGIGAARVFAPGEKVKYRTRDFFGTLSLIPDPSAGQLAEMTQSAREDMRYPAVRRAALPARPNAPARPVPDRVGEPSPFKHVIYVIKENRTYDQVLGDMPEGNGDPELCTFGEQYTPNQHKIAREFALLDNTYCSGVQSADGHQWTDSAITNEYVERQLTSDFPRSYPGGKTAVDSDALAWSSSGFIWDQVLAHGKTFRNYGEWLKSESGWSDPDRTGEPGWADFWQDYKNGSAQTRLVSRPAIESLRGCSDLNTAGFDLRVPDVLRAKAFIEELRQFEAKGGMPSLSLIFLPNDHTGGTRKDYPTPGAQVADNDLALGMIVEALSHSDFWPETCMFVIEDDPQAGWDHVSGYRTTCYVVSPYTRRHQTVSTVYDQTSLIRTMELILGIPSMNQLDATATPMFDCFMPVPDLTPFDAVPNRIPLDQINPPAEQVSDPILRQDAMLSARLPLDEADRCPEDVFNRILWRAMKGSQAPYPEWAVTRFEDDE